MACEVGSSLELLLQSATKRVILTMRAGGEERDSEALAVARGNFNQAVEGLIQHRRECPQCGKQPIAEVLSQSASAGR